MKDVSDRMFHILRIGKSTIDCTFEELSKWIDEDMKK